MKGTGNNIIHVKSVLGGIYCLSLFTGMEKGHFVRLENIWPYKQAQMLALNKVLLMRSNLLSI